MAYQCHGYPFEIVIIDHLVPNQSVGITTYTICAQCPWKFRSRVREQFQKGT
jgi:hypothetical protein